MPTAKLHESYIYAMREHEGYGLLGAHEIVQAHRAMLKAGSAQPAPYRLELPAGGILPPDERVANLRALRGQLGERGGGFRSAGDIASPPPVRCIACNLDYPGESNPKGCPRCRAYRYMRAEAAEWNGDDALESNATLAPEDGE